jgi:tryptophan synthase beta subunit
VGPEHAWLHDRGRARYIAVRDRDALRAFHWLAEEEGILPALEPSHAIFAAVGEARTRPSSDRIVVTLSGRGDKDLGVVLGASG